MSFYEGLPKQQQPHSLVVLLLVAAAVADWMFPDTNVGVSLEHVVSEVLVSVKLGQLDGPVVLDGHL